MATGQQQEGKESPRYFFRSVSDRDYRHVTSLIRIIPAEGLDSLRGCENSLKFDRYLPVTFTSSSLLDTILEDRFRRKKIKRE